VRTGKEKENDLPDPPSLNVPWVIVSRTPLCPEDSERRKERCFPKRGGGETLTQKQEEGRSMFSCQL